MVFFLKAAKVRFGRFRVLGYGKSQTGFGRSFWAEESLFGAKPGRWTT